MPDIADKLTTELTLDTAEAEAKVAKLEERVSLLQSHLVTAFPGEQTTLSTNVKHALKCAPEFFDAIASGAKSFELRKNDRGYQRGDVLVLRKYAAGAPTRPAYVRASDSRYIDNAQDAATLHVLVTYVLNGFGLEHGFVAMAITLIPTPEKDST